jgi:hypothetical protein
MSVEVWQSAPPSALQSWRAEAEAAAFIAGQLAPTSFVPDSLRVYSDPHKRAGLLVGETAAQVAAALLTGQELGLAPMAALRSIDVVNGTPALRAVAMRALVLAAGHELWLVESTNTRCVYRGRHSGSDKIQESIWDMDRARGLGLAGKTNWRTQPKAMLIARASAECSRLVAPETLLGLPYAAEELDDGTDTLDGPEPSAEASSEPRPRKRTARRAVAAAPPAEAPPLPEPAARPRVGDVMRRDDEPPPLDDDEPPAEEGRGTPPMVSPAQRTAIHAGMHALGISDRRDRLAMLSGVVGEDVASTLDLSARQASQVLDYLAELRRQHDVEPER